MRIRRPEKSCVFAAAAFGFSVLSSSYAFAVSDNVRQACKGDYYQHCSQYSVGTEELRQCMRKVGEDLSTPCLVALVQEGEITKADVERHNAAKGGKSPAKNVADNAAAKAARDPKDVSKKSLQNPQNKPKIAKTKIAADPTNAKRLSTKAKTGAKAPPEKPVNKAGKNAKKTKKVAKANTSPVGPNKAAGKKVSTVKNKKTVTKPAVTKPKPTKASAKKTVKTPKKVPEEQAP